MMMMAAAAGGPGAHTMHPVHHPAAVQPQSYTPAAAVSASAALAFSQYTAAMAANSQQQAASQAVTQGGQGQAAGTATGGYVVAPAAAGQQQTSTFLPTYTGGHGAYISMAQPHPSYDGLAGIPQYIPQGTTTQLQLVSPHQPYDQQHMINTQVPHMVGSGSQQQLGGGSQQQQQQSATGTPAPTQKVTQGTNSQVGVEIGAKPPDPAIPHGQLKQMLPNQLEYYFSRGTPILARIKHKPTNRITNFVASKTMLNAAAAGTAAVNNPPPTAGGPPQAAVATNVYRPPLPQTAGMPPFVGTAAPATNQPPPPSAGQAVQIPYPVQAPSPAQVIQQPVVVTGSSVGASMVFTTVTPSSTSTPTHAAALPQGSQDVAQVTNNSCERFNAVYNKA